MAIANSFNLDMLPTPGSSSTLQAGTTEVRNPDRTEFNRTSVYTVTDSDIGASTVRLKREVRPLENQHQPIPVHREKVRENKLVKENLTYKHESLHVVEFRNTGNVKGNLAKTLSC